MERKENRGSIGKVTKKENETLAINATDFSSSGRYNVPNIRGKELSGNEDLCSHCKRSDSRMKNSLNVIRALHKKGLVNDETLMSIERKYGRNE